MKAYVTVPTYPPVVLNLDLEKHDSLSNIGRSASNFYGHIDILINNGGVSYRGSIMETDVEVDMRVMNINYFGQIVLTKAVLENMIKRKEGHIVSIGSVQGRIAIPFRSSYASSKHAFQAFTDCLRAEVKKHNVKVTMINPGYIRTNLSLNALTGKGSNYGVMDDATLSGYDPSEVARSILKAVIKGESELTIATIGPRLAMGIRSLFPNLFFWMMQNRADRLAIQQSADSVKQAKANASKSK